MFLQKNETIRMLEGYQNTAKTQHVLISTAKGTSQLFPKTLLIYRQNIGYLFIMKFESLSNKLDIVRDTTVNYINVKDRLEGKLYLYLLLGVTLDIKHVLRSQNVRDQKGE